MSLYILLFVSIFQYLVVSQMGTESGIILS